MKRNHYYPAIGEGFSFSLLLTFLHRNPNTYVRKHEPLLDSSSEISAGCYHYYILCKPLFFYSKTSMTAGRHCQAGLCALQFRQLHLCVCACVLLCVCVCVCAL